MNCVPTKIYLAWQALLAPLPEFGEGTGWGRNLTFFNTLMPCPYKTSLIKITVRFLDTL